MRHYLKLAIATALIACAWLALAQTSWAIIDYGNGSGTRLFTSPVAAVANYAGSWGSWLGTPIAPDYFVSAKHLNVAGLAPGQYFYLGSQPYLVTEQHDDLDSDLTIWKIDPSGPAFSYNQIVPLYPSYATNNQGYELYQNNGKPLVVTGRGTAVGGPVVVGSNTQGFYWGGSDSLQSWGQNAVSSFTNFGTGLGVMLSYTFDANSTFGANEGMLSVGDSGGPVFIQDPLDGNWKLAGINYSVDAQYSTSADGSNSFLAAMFNRNGLYENEGSWVPETGPGASYSTRIASNLTFINSITQQTTWTGQGNSNSNWSNSANWAGAPSNGYSLIFDGTARTSNANNSTLSSVGAITFRDTAGAFTLSGNALTISGGVANYSANIQTISMNLTLGASQQFNAVSGNLTFGGTIALGGNVLTVTGAANTSFTSSISGTGSIAKSGNGTVTLSGNNSYSGGTTVSGGVVQMSSATALGASTGGLTVNTGGTLNMNGFSANVGGLAGTGGTILSNAAGTLTLSVGNGNGSGSYAGTIQNGAATIALTKTGTGTETLSGNDTYSGGTTVSGGTLVVAYYHALGSGPLSITNSAITQLQAGLTQPVQLPGLTIAGGASAPASDIFGGSDFNSTFDNTDQGVSPGNTPVVSVHPGLLPVPEPTTLTLALAGVLAAAAAYRVCSKR